MKCRNCGFENDINSKFCEKCGYELLSQSKELKKSRKFIRFLMLIICSVAIILTTIFIAYPKIKEKQYNDKLEIAQVYIDQQEYEKAEDSYLKAIDIEPKLADAYIGLVNMLISEDKLEEAKNVINDAKEKVNKKYIDVIKSKEEEININLAVKGYTEKLYTILNQETEGYSEESKFSLVYIDNDNIPELLISQGDWHSAQMEVYGYYNNHISNIGSFGSQGSFRYVVKQNLIDDAYGGQGNFINDFYSIKNGKSKILQSFYIEGYNIEGDLDALYKVDNQIVSDTEYNRAFNKYMNNYTWIEADENVYNCNLSNVDKLRMNYNDFISN